MNALSTAAWVAHDLGLASNFGGQLFGRWSLHPAVNSIESEDERGKVVNDAWRNYRRLSLVATGITAISWLVGRSQISGRGVGKGIRPLVIAKDILIGGMVASGLGASITGFLIGKQSPGGYLPVGRNASPVASTPRTAARMVRTVGALGTLSALFTAGVIGVTAVLAMQSGQSVRWSLRSRFLG